MTQRSRYILSFGVAIVVLLIIFGGTFAFDAIKSHFVKQYFANFKQPPIAVSATKAVSATWRPTLSAVGSLVAVNGINVNSRVAGQVVQINFKIGANGQSRAVISPAR